MRIKSSMIDDFLPRSKENRGIETKKKRKRNEEFEKKAGVRKKEGERKGERKGKNKSARSIYKDPRRNGGRG